MRKHKKSICALIILLSITIIYLFVCTVLFLFEPVYYNAPDLKDANYSFDLYDKFSYSNDNNFYIKQISYNDIVSSEDDVRMKYVDDTVLVIMNDSATISETTSLFDSINAEICGYIAILDLYQLNIKTESFSELINICSVLNDNSIVEYAIVDIFEETPENETSTNEFEYSFEYDKYYYELLGIDKLRSIIPADIYQEITVGVFDTPVYYSHELLNVCNQNEFDENVLFENILSGSASHGTHIAGIIAAKENEHICGVIPGAQIFSDNATNNSISYWVASLTNMIVNHGIKAINISMGYNSYIPVSASLGDENSIQYIIDENTFFEAFLEKILDAEYDFLLCIAAGNEGNTSLYKVNSPFFGYGEKQKLEKTDIFNIFESKPEYCDSKYQLCFNTIENPELKDRIMIVSSCNNQKEISSFSSLGDRIDIVAPGEDIYSTGFYLKYEFMTGTSMATPFVTGTAALLFALDESLTGKEVKNIITSTSVETASRSGFSYPILNIYNAVEYIINK